MNKRQLATKCGVNLKTVDNWLAKGLPSLKAKDGTYIFNLKEVLAWRLANIRPATESDPDIRAAKLRKELAIAETHELNLAVRKGELVELVAVGKLAFVALRQTRDAFQQLPDRLAGVLAAETDQNRVHQLMTLETRRILEDLKKAIGAWEYDPKLCDQCEKKRQ